MRNKLKNKHTEEFYESRYKEYKQWLKDKKLENPFSSQSAFQVAWDDYRKKGSKNPLRQMKYDTQFNTRLDTARSEFEFLKAANIDTDLKLKDLKKMTTQEFFQKFEDEIREFRKEMKTSGLNSYNANRLVAMHFFGSK